MESNETGVIVVIDLGAYCTRAGVLQQDAVMTSASVARGPSLQMPTCVSRPRSHLLHTYDGMKTVVGKNDPVLFDVSFPFINDHVSGGKGEGMAPDDDQAWADVVTILKHVFTELRVEPHAAWALVSEAPVTNNAWYGEHRRRLAHILSHDVGVARFFLANKCSLACWDFVSPDADVVQGKGKAEADASDGDAVNAVRAETALVVDMGHDFVHCVAVYEGYSIPLLTLSTNFGGHQWTRHLHGIVNAKVKQPGDLAGGDGDEAIPDLSLAAVKRIRRECRLSGADEGLDVQVGDPYVLPDGRTMQLDGDILHAHDVLFGPNGIHTSALTVVDSANEELQIAMLENVLVIGAASVVPGMTDRFLHALEEAFPDDYIRVTALGEHATWVGGCAVAHALTDADWIDAEADYGRGSTPDVVKWKCFL